MFYATLTYVQNLRQKENISIGFLFLEHLLNTTNKENKSKNIKTPSIQKLLRSTFLWFLQIKWLRMWLNNGFNTLQIRIDF